jgi:hypothetical protein
MLLFHGSNTDIKIIDLAMCRPYKDFGRGFYLTVEKHLIEYMIQDLVEILVDVQQIEYDEAMAMLYSSAVYDKVMDIETGLYRESPAYVFGLLQDEMNFGRIVQAEI